MSVLGAGFHGPSEGEKKRRAVADAARRMAKAIDELPNTSDEVQSAAAPEHGGPAEVTEQNDDLADREVAA